MKCIINRRAQFSASHRYWLPELSEPPKIFSGFGLCAQIAGPWSQLCPVMVRMAGDLDDYGMVSQSV
jgi:6-pyruvoyltetrahydropterin/6-carboxytetrahydropterin synthase